MIYYVAYRASEELKNRSQIARKLQLFGCKHVRRAFWKVEDNKISVVTRMLQKNQPIIMKRRREIERPRFAKDGRISELGSLIVIAYKGSKRDRMKIGAFLRKAPYIRICRGVYAFSQWHKRIDKGLELVDAKRFWNFIREVDENAAIFPRLIIENLEIIEKVLGETKKRVEKEVEGIIEGYKSLYQKMRQNEGDRESILSTARKLRKRFVILKKVAKFYERWLRVNLSHLLIKPYSPMKKFHSLFDKDEVTLKGRKKVVYINVNSLVSNAFYGNNNHYTDQGNF